MFLKRFTPRWRKGHCHECACRYLIENEPYNDGSWNLVHGDVAGVRTIRADVRIIRPGSGTKDSDPKGSELFGQPTRFNHAWLISSQDGTVYDTTDDKLYRWQDYHEEKAAIPRAVYSLKEAAIMLSRHLRYFAWDQTAIRVAQSELGPYVDNGWISTAAADRILANPADLAALKAMIAELRIIHPNVQFPKKRVLVIRQGEGAEWPEDPRACDDS